MPGVCFSAFIFFESFFAQEEIEEKKMLVRNRLSHLFKELRDLMGERLVLLDCYHPMDVAVFHERVVSLLSEKISLLERCKLGAALAQEPGLGTQ